MHSRPRFTGDSGSPLTATTLLLRTPTSTPQPVPQNRHGALLHLSTTTACACASGGTSRSSPHAEAAPAAAEALRNSRRLTFIASSYGDSPVSPQQERAMGIEAPC